MYVSLAAELAWARMDYSANDIAGIDERPITQPRRTGNPATLHTTLNTHLEQRRETLRSCFNPKTDCEISAPQFLGVGGHYERES